MPTTLQDYIEYNIFTYLPLTVTFEQSTAYDHLDWALSMWYIDNATA